MIKKIEITPKMQALIERMRTPEHPEKREERARLRAIEDEIMQLVGKDCGWTASQEVVSQVKDLLDDRCQVLNEMFQATEEEVRRFEKVNALLLNLTNKTHNRTANLYRSLLPFKRDSDFDDIITVEGKLTIPYDEELAVLRLENDSFYGSYFNRMHEVIHELLEHGWNWIIECLKSPEPNDSPNMTNTELGFKNILDDGNTWGEECLDRSEFNHICICYAVHDICTHKPYSIPDLLRMNDFECEAKITCEHVIKQDGSRFRWFAHCSFEEFRNKVLAEAQHRPQELRLGQFIVYRCSLPDIGTSLLSGLDKNNPNDPFDNDSKVEAYLRDVYERDVAGCQESLPYD
jgi:hypothetical protein